jgi:putative PIN family toxin of toxin-antitoxin system
VKVVLDTNVLLAAYGTRGLCEAVLTACLAAHDVYVSEPILEELKEHLGGKFKLPATRIDEILDFLKAECTLVKPDAVPNDACRDPDDLAVLGTALAAEADCIVTGDKDLLILKRYKMISIFSPRAFYQRLK